MKQLPMPTPGVALLDHSYDPMSPHKFLETMRAYHGQCKMKAGSCR